MNAPAVTPLAMLSSLLGGIGLFLLGMLLMSDGLKAIAGPALKRLLERFTSNRLMAMLSGVAVTAAVQSSSATTVMTIGFVSAGLLTLPAAIGVILGANVGTTSTGWIVSLLGLKLNVGAAALPLIGIGALLRLLSGGRRAHLGMALAGFGLIFVGIDFMQAGMAGVAERLDPAALPVDALGGRMLIVILGAATTVLLQSSSAAVAMTLTALHGGAIGIEQAALLVIGQNIGTTATAALAATGASVPARRTALAHIVFNTITAVFTFSAMRPLLALLGGAMALLGSAEPAIEIAMFHTMFNLLGVAVALPLVTPFARAIVRLLPDRGPALTRHLDRSLAHLPDVAVEAASRAVAETAGVVLARAAALLAGRRPDRAMQEDLLAAQAALEQTAAFLARVPASGNGGTAQARRLALAHASDHLHELLEACAEPQPPLHAEMREAAAGLQVALARAAGSLHGGRAPAAEIAPAVTDSAARVALWRRAHRARLLEQMAHGVRDQEQTRQLLEAMRWMEAVATHASRAVHYVSGTNETPSPPATPPAKVATPV